MAVPRSLSKAKGGGLEAGKGVGHRKQGRPNSEESGGRIEHLGAEKERQGHRIKMQHGFPVKVRSQEGRLLSCPGPEGVQKELHSHGGGYRPVATLALSHRPPPTKQPLVSVKDTFLGAAVQLVVCFLEDAKLVTQSCPTLCDPLGCSPRGSPVRGVV